LGGERETAASVSEIRAHVRADIMIPMAVPRVGGATIAILNTLVVPVL
jgi:hypothetical protein